MTPRRFRPVLPALAIGLVLALGIAETADAARRGGGFGSRGARTYQVPRTTQTAPAAAQPVARTMTTPAQAQAPAAARPTAAQAGAQQRRPGGFLGGLGGGLLGGLMLGGLLGMMMGNGFGGMAGLLPMLLQAGILALVVMLAIKFFRRRRDPALAGAGAAPTPMYRDTGPGPGPRPADLRHAGGGIGALAPRAPARAGDELGITDQDFETFEALLGEIQTAYGREDYAALRERTTPEIMGFLAEELASNATAGRRNDISEVKLLQGDLSEAWSEGETDYATVAMRYASKDVVRDRQSGAVVEGDADTPVETTEIWTFRRDGGPWGGGWKLSAVQEVSGV